MNTIININNGHLYSTHNSHAVMLRAFRHYYSGYSRSTEAAKVISAQAYQVPICTWVESGKCRVTSWPRAISARLGFEPGTL